MKSIVRINPKYSIQRIISDGVSLTRGRRSPKSGFRVLGYHSIGGNAVLDPKKLFTVPPDLFRKEIEDLNQMNKCSFKKFSRHEFLASNFSQLNVALVFDDGYKNVITDVIPTLGLYEIPFTVFISTGFIEAGKTEFLSKEDILELSNLDLVSIGSHGVNHIPLDECDDSQLEYELKESKAFLEDLINLPVTTLSYPYGSASARIKERLQEAGYELALTSRSDINRSDRDPLFLCRTDILSKDTLRIFRQKLHGCWDWGRWKTPDPAIQ